MGSFLFSLEISFAYFSSLLLSDVALSLFLHTAQRQFNPPSKGMTPRRWHRLFFFFFPFFLRIHSGIKGRSQIKTDETRNRLLLIPKTRRTPNKLDPSISRGGGGDDDVSRKKEKRKKNIFFYLSCLSGDAYLRPFYSLRSLISGDFEFQTGAPIQSCRKGTPLCWRTGTQR